MGFFKAFEGFPKKGSSGGSIPPNVLTKDGGVMNSNRGLSFPYGDDQETIVNGQRIEISSIGNNTRYHADKVWHNGANMYFQQKNDYLALLGDTIGGLNYSELTNGFEPRSDRLNSASGGYKRFNLAYYINLEISIKAGIINTGGMWQIGQIPSLGLGRSQCLTACSLEDTGVGVIGAMIHSDGTIEVKTTEALPNGSNVVISGFILK